MLVVALPPTTPPARRAPTSRTLRVVQAHALDHGSRSVKAISDFTWGLVPYPKGKKGYGADLTFWAYTIAAGLPDNVRQAAWQWIKFLSSEDGQKVDAGYLVSIPFTDSAQAVFSQKIREAAPKLEHPETIGELLKKYPYTRVIAVEPSTGRTCQRHWTKR